MNQDVLTFSEIYYSYELCLKNKKRKNGTYNFVDRNLCENLYNLLEEINNRTYIPSASNCYVVKYPAYREIFAAQFKDRIVQHFFMNELGDILNSKLVKGCSSCIKNRGTGYALNLVKEYVENIKENKNGISNNNEKNLADKMNNYEKLTKLAKEVINLDFENMSIKELFSFFLKIKKEAKESLLEK